MKTVKGEMTSIQRAVIEDDWEVIPDQKMQKVMVINKRHGLMAEFDLIEFLVEGKRVE